MRPDPKWFEIFNGIDVRLSLAVTCGVLLKMSHWNWFPPLEAWQSQALWLGFILFSCMSVFGIIKFILTYDPSAPR